jgi:S1-C subfamily serine protease
MTWYVVIDNQWRGGDAGLALLANVLGLKLVACVGTDISLTGVAELQKVEQLERLWLYGTKLEADDLPKVQSLLPQVSLDFRRGGLLGVGANQFEVEAGPAVVGTVQKGGVAEAAGIRIGDVIQKFNGQPVASFKELTTKIGQLRAGEEVKLDVVRDGKPITFTIKLGQWETI